MSTHRNRSSRNVLHRNLLESLESRLLLTQTPLPITVFGNSNSITSDTSTTTNPPTFTTGTDFRYASTTAPAALGAMTRTYTVTNTSNATLNFGNITISGPNAADFAMISPLPASLAAQQPGNLTIQFLPTTVGVRSAIVTIAGANPGDQPFIFEIQGTGIATQNLPDGLEIGVIQPGVGNAGAVNGDILNMSYAGFLFNGFLFDTNFGANSTLSVRLDDAPGHPYYFNSGNSNPNPILVIDGWNEGLQGMKPGESRVLIIPSALGYGANGSPPKIAPNTPLIFETTLARLDYSPEIGVTGAGGNYVEPGSAANATLGTDFGTLPQGQTTITSNITLHDYSSADDANGNFVHGLTFAGAAGFSISGANPSDFSITRVLNQAGVYSITFQPTGLGQRSAVIHVSSNDRLFPDYTFAVQGVNPRQLSVSANSLTIPNGDTTPLTTDFTDFSYQATNFSDPVTRTYTITNTGTDVVTLGNITIGGANTADFFVSNPPGKSSLNPNESTTFTVEFSPTGAGPRAAIITIASDAPLAPYTFAVDGVGVNATTLAGPVKIATLQNGSGNVTAVNGDVLQITFSGALLTGGVFSGTAGFRLDNVSGHPYLLNDPSTANIKNAYDIAQIAGWENGLQGIRFGESRLIFVPAAQAVGATANGTLLPSGPLLYLVTCTGIAYSPQIGVMGGNVNIVDGSATPNAGDGTDFGTLTGSQSSITHDFSIIDNSAADDAFGNRVSNLGFNGASSFTFTGPDAADFSVAIVPGQAGVYAIKFQPLAAGTRTATVHVMSNDPNHSNYSFAVQGVNAATPDLQLTLGATAFPVAPFSTNSNTTLALPVTITNIAAGADAANATADVQIFAHNTSTGENRLIASIPAQSISLLPGGSTSTTLNAPIPATLPTGTYTLMAIVNGSHAIVDPDPANDSAVTAQTFSVLSVFNNITGNFVSTTIPAHVMSHTPIAGNLTLMVTNAGTLALSKTQQVAVTLLAHNTATGAETTLIKLPLQSLASLKVGGSVKIVAAVKLPAGLPSGNYSYAARLTPTPALAQSSTADDVVTSSFQLLSADPDISGSLSTAKLPPNIIAGSPTVYSGSVTLLLTNPGAVNLPAVQHVTVTVMAQNLSTGRTVTLKSAAAPFNLSNLSPGQSRPAVIPFQFTGTQLPPGTYAIQTRITPVERLVESSVSDNLVTTTRAGTPLTFSAATPTFDLTGTLISTSLKSTAKGVAGTLNLTIRSQGNVPLTGNQQVKLQIIAHPSGAADASHDIVLTTATLSVAGLAPQKSAPATVTVASAKVLRGGTYIIEGLLVPAPHLSEISSDNNLLTQKVLTLVSTNPA